MPPSCTCTLDQYCVFAHALKAALDLLPAHGTPSTDYQRWCLWQCWHAHLLGAGLSHYIAGSLANSIFDLLPRRKEA